MNPHPDCCCCRRRRCLRQQLCSRQRAAPRLTPSRPCSRPSCLSLLLSPTRTHMNTHTCFTHMLVFIFVSQRWTAADARKHGRLRLWRAELRGHLERRSFRHHTKNHNKADKLIIIIVSVQLLQRAQATGGAPPAPPDVISSLPKINVTQARIGWFHPFGFLNDAIIYQMDIVIVVMIPSDHSASPCVDGDQNSCSVCQDSFTLDEIISELPCKHGFHTTCIEPWLNLVC